MQDHEVLIPCPCISGKSAETQLQSTELKIEAQVALLNSVEAKFTGAFLHRSQAFSISPLRLLGCQGAPHSPCYNGTTHYSNKTFSRREDVLREVGADLHGLDVAVLLEADPCTCEVV